MESGPSENEQAEHLSAYCRTVLDFTDLPRGDAPAYAHLPLCVIDAIWSLNARYEAVKNVVSRCCVHADLPDPYKAGHDSAPWTTSAFVAAIDNLGVEEFAQNVFQNRQRTSTQSGILKAEAVHQFARILRERGIETLVDVTNLRGDFQFERSIAAIPGQGSGISLRYFYMLCGASDLVKPDRMILRFIQSAIKETQVTPAKAQRLLSNTAQLLQPDFPDITARGLDTAIWRFQRGVKGAKKEEPAALDAPPITPDDHTTKLDTAPAPESENPTVVVAESHKIAPAEDETEPNYHVRMRQIPADERPRERLLHYGADVLSLPELLAILLRTGTEERNVIALAEYLLSNFGGLRGLASLSTDELGKVHGVGPAKAAQIKAAVEFGRRLVASSPEERPKIRSPRDVYNLIGPGLRDEKREHFVALLMDTKGGVLRQRTISVGDLSSSLVHPREVFLEAIRHSAASLIVAHNHPSGDPTPSPEDGAVTRRLVEAGELLGIDVLDHIVLGDNRWISLKEKGMM